MNVIQIIEQLTKLQIDIPEQIFKIKNEIINHSTIPIEEHPYVVSLLKKNKKIRKTNKYLKTELLNLLLKNKKNGNLKY